MRVLLTICLLLLSGIVNGEDVVLLKTSEGDIKLRLNTDQAPITATNFLALVDGGHLNGGNFYRVVNPANDRGKPVITVIQGGMNYSPAPFPPIAHESTEITGLSHVDGTISMARFEVGTAGTEFFICIDDQPGLDHGAPRNADGQGFAAFGQVIEGMDVVRSINQLPATGQSDSPYTEGQILAKPVMIHEAVRVR